MYNHKLRIRNLANALLVGMALFAFSNTFSIDITGQDDFPPMGIRSDDFPPMGCHDDEFPPMG